MRLDLLSAFAFALLPWGKVYPNDGHDIGLDDETSAWITAAMEDWDIPGVSIAVVRSPTQSNGESWISESRGYGVRNGQGQPVTDKTIMAIGSNSKLFTAFATGLMVENGSLPLEWTSKVADVLPEFRLFDEIATRQTNLIDLLGHRTGLPRHELSYGSRSTPLDTVRNLRHLKPSAEFREHWQYNNMMYTAASLIPERLASMTLEEYVRHHILDPLNMTETFYDVKGMTETGHLADGFYAFDRNLTQCHADFKSNGAKGRLPSSCLGQERSLGWWLAPGQESGIAGAGGVAMSANDMAKWLQMLLVDGKSPDTGCQVIPASVVAACAAARTVPLPGHPALPEKGVSSYGMAQFRYSYRGHDLIEHGGSVTGFKSQITRLPDVGLGIGITVNTEQHGTAFVELLKNNIIDRVLGINTTDWNARLKIRIFNSSSPAAPRRPEDPCRPTLPLAKLAGRYHNTGYGSWDLCLHSDDSNNATNACRRLLKEPAVAALPKVDLITKVDNVWDRYVGLSHFDGDWFNMTTAAVAQSGEVLVSDALDEQPLVLFGPNGFGLSKFWGAGPGVKDGNLSLGLAEGSEVYFERCP